MKPLVSQSSHRFRAHYWNGCRSGLFASPLNSSWKPALQSHWSFAFKPTLLLKKNRWARKKKCYGANCMFTQIWGEFKIFWACIIWSLLFPAAHAKVLNAICSKICIQDYPVDTICAAHKRKCETELKHRDQTVTYQSFFLAQFLCNSREPQCIPLLLMQWSETVFA